MILVTPRNVYGNLSVCGVRHVLVYVSVLGLNVSLGDDGEWVTLLRGPTRLRAQSSGVVCTVHTYVP